MDDPRNTNSCSALPEADLDELFAIARQCHSAQSWLTWVMSKVGMVTEFLPARIKKVISAVLGPALRGSNWAASYTHVRSTGRSFKGVVGAITRSKWFHRISVIGSGAAGGFFGAPTAVADVGASTTMVLRQVQTIAMEYGEDLADPEARLECVNVLALGGPERTDDQLDEAFWTTRASLKAAVTQGNLLKLMGSEEVQKAASKEAAQRILNSPILIRILERFGITTQAAFAAKAVPVVGAVMGAYVNYTFMSYYGDMAHVHYRLKQLEARNDPAQVRSCFGNIMRSLRHPAAE